MTGMDSALHMLGWFGRLEVGLARVSVDGGMRTRNTGKAKRHQLSTDQGHLTVDGGTKIGTGRL